MISNTALRLDVVETPAVLAADMMAGESAAMMTSVASAMMTSVASAMMTSVASSMMTSVASAAMTSVAHEVAADLDAKLSGAHCCLMTSVAEV